MINLLPPELKQDYRYARRNYRLLRWLAAFLVAIGGVAIITGTGLFIMSNTIDSYKSRIASTQGALASQHYADTQKQVTDISNNLRLMVKVLSKEVLFSKLLARLGQVTPPGVILTDLSISQTQSGMDITAQTANYNAATQLQVNLASPTNQIFSKADIVNITCQTGSQVINPAYPCTATIRAQLTGNNPFLFINSQQAGA